MFFSLRDNPAERLKWVETELETKFPRVVLKLFKGFIDFSIVDIARVVRTPVYFKIRPKRQFETVFRAYAERVWDV